MSTHQQLRALIENNELTNGDVAARSLEILGLTLDQLPQVDGNIWWVPVVPDEGMTLAIAVSSYALEHNRQSAKKVPVVEIHEYRDRGAAHPVTDARHAYITGPSTLLYTPDEPLGGAPRRTAVLVTTSVVLAAMDKDLIKRFNTGFILGC